jgi:hypothetical protein
VTLAHGRYFNKMSLGRSTEDIVENLCRRSFFADFTIRSPKYYKLRGLEKEAADLLIVFNDTLLAIQVKSKKLNSISVKTNPTEMSRMIKAVNSAIHQFRALGEALNNQSFKSFVNGHGTEVPFDKDKIKKLVLIVVFVPIWEAGADEPGQIRFDPACYSDGPIPVHLFSLHQFTALLTMLDTLPDFLSYLNARWGLHNEGVIPPDSDPVDEWALITFEKKRLVEILEKRTPVDISGFCNRHIASVEQLERQEKPSYFVDRLIERFHAAIGVEMPVDSRFTLLAKPNSIQSYNLMIHHLAKLNRKERSLLTEFLMRCVKNCDNMLGIAFRGFKFNEQGEEAYVVLASKHDRHDRRTAVTNVARGMALQFQVKTMIGLVVGHNWPVSTACDVCVIDVSKMKIDDDLIEFTKLGFKKPRATKR